MDFRELIPPLSRRERLVFLALCILVALSRLLAISKSLWDWDEALFVLAMRDYDVAAFHPHPPGFPLFIAAAKLVPLDPFHALQTIVVLSSLFVFPAAFFLARELRASAFVAFASALLVAFMPNVWFYGGTALSDVPSMVLSLVASGLLLRGCRSDRALIAGCVVLGIAAGIRPQNLIIGAAPFVIAFLCRRRAAIIGAIVTAVIVIACYWGAVVATGDLAAYRSAVSEHGRYIRATDSFLSDIRPSLLQVADDFFLRPFRAPLVNVMVIGFALIGLVRRRRPAVSAVMIFGPFLFFAWLFLDFHSASRFSVAYMPLFAILAAEGMDVRGRLPLAAIVVSTMVLWTLPALEEVRSSDSPPVEAVTFIRATLDPRTTRIDFDPSLGPHVAVFLGDYVGTDVVRLKEGRGKTTFTRPRERLAGIARPRYFEISID
jgi:hypothetical protein